MHLTIMRGAYCDIPHRDVIGCLAVGHVRELRLNGARHRPIVAGVPPQLCDGSTLIHDICSSSSTSYYRTVIGNSTKEIQWYHHVT